MTKIKTSVSIESDLLGKVKAAAKAEDRSVSYILEKFIEARVNEMPEPGTAEKRKAVNYRKLKKRK